MERNERRLARRVLKTGPIWNLPLNIIEIIWREVRNAGRRARRALLRRITVDRIVNFWIRVWDDGQFLATEFWDSPFRLINQMRKRWLSLNKMNRQSMHVIRSGRFAGNLPLDIYRKIWRMAFTQLRIDNIISAAVRGFLWRLRNAREAVLEHVTEMQITDPRAITEISASVPHTTPIANL